MDTISVTVRFSKMLTWREIEKIENSGFIKVNKAKKEYEKFIFKISYPKFIGENNATLITNKEDVLRCNKRFVEILKELRPYDGMILNINRIDIPITYIMPENKNFREYKGLFYLLAKLYSIKREGVCGTKGILDLKDERFETIIYADTKNVKDYNSKIMFYDQYARYADTYKESMKDLVKKHPDLNRRMRIEVSKKINRVPMKLENFGDFDLLGKYNQEFMEYILENLFDLELLWKELEQQKEKWKIMFNTKLPNFTNKFLWEVVAKEDMYEPMREAIKFLELEKKTQEYRITILRKELIKIEEKEKQMILDLYIELLNIRKFVASLLKLYN